MSAYSEPGSLKFRCSELDRLNASGLHAVTTGENRRAAAAERRSGTQRVRSDGRESSSQRAAGDGQQRSGGDAS